MFQLRGSTLGWAGPSNELQRPSLYLPSPALLAEVLHSMTKVECPRAGLIHLVSADQVLVELRQSMR